MIFRQWREIAEGRKTQTRRKSMSDDIWGWFNHPVEVIRDVTGVKTLLRWNPEKSQWVKVVAVGDVIVVQPKMYQPAIFWRDAYLNEAAEAVEAPREWAIAKERMPQDPHSYMRERFNMQAMTVTITDLGLEYLHEITEEDARAEGVASIAEYKALWDEIHPKAPYSWEHNIYVSKRCFKVNKPV